MRITRTHALTAAMARFLAAASFLGTPAPCRGQDVIRPDLAGVATGDGWALANRAATADTVGGRLQVTFDARAGDGAAWLEGLDFRNGTIEVSLRGKNVPQSSFVGVAFRGVDDTTFDAVYFRPFNFLADDELSRSHAVQYVSHPEHTWARLRQEHPGEYENAMSDPPDPDGFFRVRIVVEKAQVRVYLVGRPEPVLVVDELSARTGGRVGLWMGNGSDGTFADLVIRPEP